MPESARTRRDAVKPPASGATSGLVGIDLQREGLLKFEVKPDDASWSFDGAPVCDGRTRLCRDAA